MKRKKSKSIHNIIITSEKLKLIEKLENEIKSNINNEEYLKNLFRTPESMEVIKCILSKFLRNEIDIFILKEYLKRLNGLMSILKESNEESLSIELLLKKISNDLKCEIYHEGSFLMKVGNIGKTFYVTLSGSVSILVPKGFQRIMNIDEYINHLRLLYTWEENYLFDKTFNENSKNITIKINEAKQIIEKEKINGRIPMEIEEYISRINGEKFIKNNNEKKNKINIKIYGYIKIIDLGIGSTFGEIALINENCQRTATIYVKESSCFGTINKNSYKNSIKSIQERVKRENINFIYNILFSQITLAIFTQNYWNFFIKNNIKRGNYIFKFGKIRKEFIFLKDGEIKIILPNFTYKKIKKLINILDKKDNESLDNLFFEEENEKGDDFVIKIAKSGDILGLNDLLIYEKYFCNAICESHESTYFTIDSNLFYSIFEGYNIIINNINKIQKKKINLILFKLKNIKHIIKITKKNNKNKLSQIKKFGISNKNMFKTIQNSFELETKKNEITKSIIKRNRYLSNFGLNTINKDIPYKRNSIFLHKKLTSLSILKTDDEFKNNNHTSIKTFSSDNSKKCDIKIEKQNVLNIKLGYNNLFNNKIIKRNNINLYNSNNSNNSNCYSLEKTQNIETIPNYIHKNKLKNNKILIYRRKSNSFYSSLPSKSNDFKNETLLSSEIKHKNKAKSFNNNINFEINIMKKIMYYGHDPITNILIKDKNEQIKKGIFKFIFSNSKNKNNKSIYTHIKNYNNKIKFNNYKFGFFSPKATPISLNYKSIKKIKKQ